MLVARDRYKLLPNSTGTELLSCFAPKVQANPHETWQTMCSHNNHLTLCSRAFSLEPGASWMTHTVRLNFLIPDAHHINTWNKTWWLNKSSTNLPFLVEWGIQGWPCNMRASLSNFCWLCLWLSAAAVNKWHAVTSLTSSQKGLATTSLLANGRDMALVGWKLKGDNWLSGPASFLHWSWDNHSLFHKVRQEGGLLFAATSFRQCVVEALHGKTTGLNWNGAFKRSFCSQPTKQQKQQHGRLWA